MAAAREQGHAVAQRGLILDLGQDPPTDRDHRISGQHQIVGKQRGDRGGLLASQPLGMDARQFAGGDAFIDFGGVDGIGHNPDPGQQVEPARARRRQDQAHQAGMPGPPRPGMKR